MQKLEWDSNFFKKNIFQLNLDTGFTEIEYENIKKELQSAKADLAYIFIDNGVSIPNYLSTEDKAMLMDKKVVFEKQVSFEAFSPTNKIFLFEGDINEDLEFLAIEAGKYSRFKTEPLFANNFAKLYTTWMVNSLSKIIADKVFVSKNIDNKITGVVTCRVKENTGYIGILSVSPQYQGTGIGRELMMQAEHYFGSLDVKKIEVPTQLENSIACKFYSKLSFQVKSITSIYHLTLNKQNDTI